jgi:hypothetical protein
VYFVGQNALREKGHELSVMVSVFQQLALHQLDRKNELQAELWVIKKGLRRIEMRRRQLSRYKSSRCRMEFHGELLEKYNAHLLRYATDEWIMKTKKRSLQAKLASCERRIDWLRARLRRRSASPAMLVPSVAS